MMESPTTIRILNQLFELEKKIAKSDQAKSMQRNLKRIKSAYDELGYSWHSPLGEKYDETRADCEASLAGEATENLHIVEVIKPIIFHNQNGQKEMIQQAVVVVEGK